MSTSRTIFALVSSLLIISSLAGADGYNKPPQNILSVLHAPSLPQPIVSPTRDTMLLVSMQNYPPMSRVQTPFLKLAGVRIEPKNHSRHDTPGGYGIVLCATNFTLVNVADSSEIQVTLPAGSCPRTPTWSADGTQFAFSNITDSSVELWVGDAKSGEIRRIPGVQLNPMLGYHMQWMPDQKMLLVKLVPSTLGAPPKEPTVATGPSIQETSGERGQSSTYEARDTLKNKYDEDLFDYYASAQLALVNAASGEVTTIGKPAAYLGVAAAPDGKHISVSMIRRPYSYITTYERFGRDVEIWNTNGIVVKKLASLPLADRVPIHGVATGPRGFEWRANEPATIVWAEALDGGDWNVHVPARDKIMMLKAPFTAPATEVTRLEQRYAGFLWGERSDVALVADFDENRHWTRTFLINVDDPKELTKLFDLSSDDHYGDPGSPVMRTLPNGVAVLHHDGDAIFLSGEGSSPGGDRPFLDRFDLKTLKSERLFRSDKAAYEQFVSFAGMDTKRFITWHQSKMDPPNAFIRALSTAFPDAAAGEAQYESSVQAVTNIGDPTPEVRAIQKRLVNYKRADGVDLSFTIYTPPGYKEGTRVPTILYAYPLDYAQASTAGQVTGSQETFTRLRQYQLLLLAGYAIIDKASFPIVGDPKMAYDNYLEQLVADAKAAVDKAVEIGIADPKRIGVTGHSHGALMTANLVAHSDLFKAGVATSGSYNKTLTPFGFQSERRSVWEAPSVYQQVSPFFSANKVKKPLLIIHGEDDANPGTTPLQSHMLYQAIRGNGGIARLVMLPHEPHWYAAMESNEQLIYEMLSWFDRYVREE